MLFLILNKNLILFVISIEIIDSLKQVINPIFVFGFLIFKNNKRAIGNLSYFKVIKIIVFQVIQVFVFIQVIQVIQVFQVIRVINK